MAAWIPEGLKKEIVKSIERDERGMKKRKVLRVWVDRVGGYFFPNILAPTSHYAKCMVFTVII